MTRTASSSVSSRQFSFGLLNKIRERKARQYVKACEQQEEPTFHDFERQVLECIASLGVERDSYGQSFVELVILDVESKHIFMNIRSEDDWFHKQVFKMVLENRRKNAEELWGKTTKYHARLYRDLIISELARRGFLRSTPQEIAANIDEDDVTVDSEGDDSSLVSCGPR